MGQVLYIFPSLLLLCMFRALWVRASCGSRHIKGKKGMPILYDKAQHTDCQGKPSFLSYKTTLERQLSGKKMKPSVYLLFGCGVLCCCFGVQCLEE